jgi:hypothetical protein
MPLRPKNGRLRDPMGAKSQNFRFATAKAARETRYQPVGVMTEMFRSAKLSVLPRQQQAGDHKPSHPTGYEGITVDPTPRGDCFCLLGQRAQDLIQARANRASSRMPRTIREPFPPRFLPSGQHDTLWRKIVRSIATMNRPVRQQLISFHYRAYFRRQSETDKNRDRCFEKVSLHGSPSSFDGKGRRTVRPPFSLGGFLIFRLGQFH